MSSNIATVSFGTKLSDALEQLDALEPEKYGRTRNYTDGAVSYLSPYISRGVLSTRQVYDHLIDRGHDPKKCEKFIQELAWRDHWQLQWQAHGNDIDRDLKHPQKDVQNREMPGALVEAQTGIDAIDQAIEQFYEGGYLHNHVRMYVAAIACNMGKSHWWQPARWMYYHLLDGDWASNALSWQWVAGSNSNKKYVANQQNINKYCHSEQRETFLDVPYSAFEHFQIPRELQKTVNPALNTPLPKTESPNLGGEKDVAVYTYYNLDPAWRSGEDLHRILLLEPSVFEQYPVSANAIDFATGLAKNIDGIQIAVMEFDKLAELAGNRSIHFKEHPLNRHFRGEMDERDWLTSVKGDFRSFFAYWKKAKKELL